MSNPPALKNRTPTGIAFGVDELVAVKGWADWRDLRMAVELDYVIDGEEYEEVLGLYELGHRLRLATLWRSPEGVMVVLPGAESVRRFAGVWDALKALADVIPPPALGRTL
jgi:hypothetical protein